MVTSINGPAFSSGDAANRLVVMLHGRGASGDNMIAVATHMSKRIPNAQFVAPHACKPYGTGYTWFTDSIRDMEESSAFIEIMEAVKVVNKFIDEQLGELGISDEQLSLVGFSQGAMLSVYVGLSRAKRCASVLAYSGAIPFPHLLEPNIRSKPDVCVIHGKSDEVIPFYYFEQSVAFLRNNSVPVVCHGLDDLDHSISGEGLEIGSRFIKGHFSE